MSIAATADLILPDATPLDSAAIVAKILRRLIPFLCVLFIVNYLDRTNVAMAKLRMLDDLRITAAAYGFGAGLFFVGYFIFEVPSNLILEKVGARRWIARIMISWGVISAAMMFTRGTWSFYALRFTLGVAEAGFFPGIVLYLTYWVPAKQRAQTLAAFLTSTALSGVIGNPLAGALMKLDGIAGLHGWQWLFLLEGIPPVLLGIAILIFPLLPDRPIHARWLSDDERRWISEQLARDGVHPHVHHVADLPIAMADARLWLLSAIYFLLIMGLYGFIYWLPTLVHNFTRASDFHVGLLSAIPYLIAAGSMVVIGRLADRRGERQRYVAACAVIGAAGVAIVSQCHSAIPGMLALCLAAIGIFGTLGPFWTIPTRFLRGTAAAGGIAIVNSIGALAGFVAPSLIGKWFTIGLLVVAGSLVLGSVLVMCVPRSADAGAAD
ncbi:MAG TPA: MFS transporter [Tepidisphaeraceae bacterium]|nr:MFS transporter [Tepidisphaeraceae bacterium]